MTIPKRPVYATQPQPLRQQIDGLLKASQAASIDGEIVAVIVPDSNLLSGGNVAAAIYSTLRGHDYDTVILVAPSHQGAFNRLHVCSLDTYHTPLGELEVNDHVRNELCDEDDDIFLDDRGHFHTEGVDVQLPFLQTVLDDFDIVPIVMGDESPDFCRELGHAIGEIMYNRRTLVVASADVLDASPDVLDHFRENFEAGNESELMALLNSETMRVEGKGAVLTALIAARHRSATRTSVLRLETPENGQPGCIGAVLWRG